MGKTTAPHGLQDITMRGLQRWGTETTIPCSLASPTGGYNRGNDLFLTLSRSVTVHSYTHTQKYMTFQQHYNKFSLSHIYTNMTFELFTPVAPRGALEHIHIFVSSNNSGRSPSGLQSSGSSNFSSGGTCFPSISAYGINRLTVSTIRGFKNYK